MKKKFAAFLREENSLRELVISGAGKPAVDPAAVRQWQSKINLLAMEAGETVALLLRVQQASINILLKSNHLDQAGLDHYLAGGLYLKTDLGNQGLLITSSASEESAGMASVTTCFGLPIHWPDDVLFGVICVLNYPGKALKPVYENILIDLRETIEQTLDALLTQHLSPAPSPVEAPAPPQAAAEPREPDPAPETDKPEAAAKPDAPASAPAAEPKPAAAPAQSQTQQHADTDALTAIYGRKKIEDILKHEFERAKRYFKTFSITMIDLNGLQAINASLGRDAGDEILKAFAKSVGAKIRETDSWGRWGGDEFILVCPYADTVETQQMFTRIKPLVSRDMKEAEGFADFSFGVSQYEPDDLSYQTIVNRAEENMHHYKEVIKRKPFLGADDRNANSR